MPESPSHKDVRDAWLKLAVASLCGIVIGLLMIIMVLGLLAGTTVTVFR